MPALADITTPCPLGHEAQPALESPGMPAPCTAVPSSLPFPSYPAIYSHKLLTHRSGGLSVAINLPAPLWDVGGDGSTAPRGNLDNQGGTVKTLELQWRTTMLP